MCLFSESYNQELYDFEEAKAKAEEHERGKRGKGPEMDNALNTIFNIQISSSAK